MVDMDRKQLFKLLQDLYRLSKENRAFFHARFGVGDDPIGTYKKTIDECMHPDIYSNKPIQIAKAKKAVSSYSKTVGDPLGVDELMVFFVECGNNFPVLLTVSFRRNGQELNHRDHRDHREE